VKEAAKPALGKTQTIPGRNVIVTNPGTPCRFQDRIGILISDHRKFISQRNSPQAEFKGWLVVETADRVIVHVRAPTIVSIEQRVWVPRENRRGRSHG
jgi:hypothetical protein